MPESVDPHDTSLTIVVPAFQEAHSIASTLAELRSVCDPRGWPIVVVDDGSTDATGRLAQEAGVQVVQHKVRRGYGGALKSGIRATTTEWVVTVDADGQHDPADLTRLLGVATSGDADMVVGNRGTAGTGRYRRVGRWLIRTLTTILQPHAVRDLNSGLKLYRTALARRYLSLCPDSMAFSDVITLVFVSNRHLVLEHPVRVRPRRAGRSTVTTQTAFETVMEVVHIMTLFNPARIFLPLAIACWIAGLAWGIPIVLRGRGVSVGSMLALTTGVILFALGLLAEQLAAVRRKQVAENEDREGVS